MSVSGDVLFRNGGGLTLIFSVYGNVPGMLEQHQSNMEVFLKTDGSIATVDINTPLLPSQNAPDISPRSLHLLHSTVEFSRCAKRLFSKTISQTEYLLLSNKYGIAAKNLEKHLIRLFDISSTTSSARYPPNMNFTA